MYSTYEVKIVDNAVLKICQETDLYQHQKYYNEVSELLELFMYKALPHRERELKIKKKEIDEKYLPYIRECKRVLNNTKKRFNYNLERA
jgi:hypothetical protein